MISALLGTFAPAAFAVPPSPEAAASAFAAARGWLDRAEVPAAAPDPAGVSAAAAILRLHGRVLGTGKALADDGTALPAAAAPPASTTVARAVRAAFDAARQATPAADRAALGTRLTLELEVAGSPEPLVGRTFEEIARGIEPAECGLALRHAQSWAYMPACVVMARRMAAPLSRPILALVTELQLPPRDLPDLQAAASTALYAVRGIRLAQVAPDAAPFTVARALPAVAADELPADRGAALAGGIVARLAAQLTPPRLGDGVTPDIAATLARGGLHGDYAIAADLYEPIFAAPADQALAAWALARASHATTWPESLRTQARDASCAVLRALADVDPAEDDPAQDPAAAALALLALDALRADGPIDACGGAMESRLAEALAGALAPAPFEMHRPAVASVLLAAAAARERAGTPALASDALRSRLDDAWKRTPPAQLVANGAFLLLAERSLARDDAALAARLAPVRASLDAACAVLAGTQQRRLADDAPATLADATGAFPVTGAIAGRASSQSARAQLLVALVAALPPADPTHADATAAARAHALRAANRFLSQLAAGPEVRAFGPDPARAVGGILASTVDLVQPLAAQSMAIWALAESEAALAPRPAGGAGLPASPAPTAPTAP